MPTARKLGVDYTTVSRRISELEKSLATSLFERKSDGFVPTEDGERLLKIAEKMEGLSLLIKEGVQSEVVTPSGRVRLASMEGIAAFYLSEKLGQFAETHKHVVVELVTERFLLNLIRREADVSVSFVPPVGPKLKVIKAGTFGLGLFASQNYIARHGAPTAVSELPDHEYVDYVNDLIEIEAVHWLLDVLNPEHVVFRSTSMAAQQNAAAAGMGIALLPFFSAKTDRRLIPILPDDVVVSRDLFVSVHEDLEYIGRVRALVRFLCSLFQNDSHWLNNSD